MRIAIVEMDYHVADLDGFCRIFDHTLHELTILTTKPNYARLQQEADAGKCRWILIAEESLKNFFSRHLQDLNTHDLIYFNTIASRYSAYARTKFTAPTVLRVHNANTYLQPWSHLYFSAQPFYVYKAISYLVREFVFQLDWYYLPKIIKRMNFFTFNDKSIEEFIRQHHYLPEEKIFPAIPSSVSAGEFPALSSTETIRICIPGLIDSRKRNYLEVAEAWRLAGPLIGNKVELVLLGKPIGNYGREVLAKLKELQHINFSVISFDHFVEQEIFNDYLSKSHLLISPNIETTSFRIYQEVYGKTKFPGIIAEMVKFGLPTIFPAHFSMDEEFQKHIEAYSNPAELSALIVKYCNQPELLKSRAANFRNFIRARYNPEIIVKQIETFLRRS